MSVACSPISERRAHAQDGVDRNTFAKCRTRGPARSPARAVTTLQKDARGHRHEALALDLCAFRHLPKLCKDNRRGQASGCTASAQRKTWPYSPTRGSMADPSETPNRLRGFWSSVTNASNWLSDESLGLRSTLMLQPFFVHSTPPKWQNSLQAFQWAVTAER